MCAKAVMKTKKKASKKKAATSKKLSGNGWPGRVENNPAYGHSYSSRTGFADLVVIVGKDAELPDGFDRKIPVDLNEGAGGAWLFLCYKEAKRHGITDLRLTTGKNPKAPKGYTLVKDQNGKVVDLNLEADHHGESIWLSYSKDDVFDVITGIGAIAAPSEIELIKVESSRWNRVDNKDLNDKAKGWYVYLTYKRWL